MLDPAVFAYDRLAALELVVYSEQVRDNTTVQDITYASPVGGKVPAYLIFPASESPRAGWPARPSRSPGTTAAGMS
jgi:hypothetical protein